LAAVASLAAATLLLALAMAPFLRGVAALVLVFLPSYLITWPLLRPRLGSAAAFTIAGGLSIGMVALAGLVLNLLPWGLQAATWLAYVVVLLVVALVMGRRPGAWCRGAWHPDAWRAKVPGVRQEALLIGIGAMLVVTAVLFARLFAGYPTESFTQLWIARSADTSAPSVDVAIRSEEQSAMDYRLEVWRDGALVKSWSDIHLADGQEWRVALAVDSGRIEARLYRRQDPVTVFRHVTLQLAGSVQASAEPGP
jgi:uncharacterized membrane protein